LIAIEEELEEDSTLGTSFHFGTGLYLYPNTLVFFVSFDPNFFQVPIESLGKILVQLNMAKHLSTSQTISSNVVVVESSFVTSSMFYTTFELHLYGESSIMVGYQSLSGTHSEVSSTPLSSPMSSTRILPGSSLMGTQQFDSAYRYKVGQSGQQRPMCPLNTGLPPYEEKYAYSPCPLYSVGLPYGNIS